MSWPPSRDTSHASASPVLRSLVGQQLAAYQLEDPLERSERTEIYRAFEVTTGQQVAVKVLASRYANLPSQIARFQDESAILARLKHRNIVPVVYAGEAQGMHFYVMPLYPSTLRDAMQRGRPKPLAAIQLMLALSEGVAQVHELGLVHRDIRPEHILLTKGQEPVLTGFDLARDARSLAAPGALQTRASGGLPVGTPHYMPIEQMQGGQADHRIDIYALGAVLYELLTGTPPHNGETPWDVTIQLLKEAVVPPSQRNPAVSPTLNDVVMRALANDLRVRYADAYAFSQALQQAQVAQQQRR